MESMAWHEKEPEPPVSFNDDFELKDIWHRSTKHENDMARQALSDHRTDRSLRCLNFLDTSSYMNDAIINAMNGWSLRIRPSSNDHINAELLRKLSGLMERRKRVLESARRRLENEAADAEKRDRILQEEIMKLDTDKQNILVTPLSMNLQIQNIALQKRLSPNIGIKALPFPAEPPKFNIDIETTAWDKASQVPNPTIKLVKPEISLIPALNLEVLRKPPPRQRICHHHDHSLKLAPDGELPNSIIGKVIQPAKGAQLFNAKGTMPFHKKVKAIVQETKVKEAVNEVKEKEDFKSKLKQMLAKKEAEALAKLAEAEKEAASQPTVPDDDGADIDIDDDDSAHPASRRRLPNVTKPLKLVEALEPIIPQKYPKIIEQALVYSWFPHDEIFFPVTPGESTKPEKPKKGERPKELNRMKIDPTGEAMIPILLDVFRKATSATVRMEIVDYIKWIQEEFGLRDTTPIVRFFCKYLQSIPFIQMTEIEMELRYLILDSLEALGFQQLELVPSVLMQTVVPHEKIREKAKEILNLMGVLPESAEYAYVKVREFFAENEAGLQSEAITTKPPGSTAGKSALLNSNTTPNSNNQANKPAPPPITQSPASMEFRNNIMGWLRKTLRKYLLRTAKDDEIVAKLKEMNDSGLIDRNKKGMEEKEKEDGLTLAAREKDKLRQIEKAARRVTIVEEPITDLPPAIPKTALDRRKSSLRRKSQVPVPKDMLERRSVVAERRQSLKKKQEKLQAAEVEKQRPTSSGTIDMLINRNGDKREQGKSSITTLQNPSVQDLITVINFYSIAAEKKFVKEERERLEKLARESEAAEKARLEKEKQEVMADFLRKKEAERLLRAEQMRARLAERKKVQEKLPEIKVKSVKGFTGETHRSKCHQSPRFPPIEDGFSHHYATSMALHIQKLSKSMPVENIDLAPFADDTKRTQQSWTRDLRGLKQSFRAPSFDSVQDKQGLQPLESLDEHREAPVVFSTSRRYFVFTDIL
ncbi:hypothetical protein HDU76_009468 [Blyttiomyces sp. JEL0837]|nr:hypothetical protein HDU76_009468 [Blyttiomyces sp. JEL0837]